MNSCLIESNYDLKVSDMKLLDRHFGTEIYAVDADTKRYIVKALPLYIENIDNEGFVTDYLYRHGHKVARFLKSRDGSYVIRTPEFQFMVQEYIKGETLPINSAPEWFLEKSADFLGKTTMDLKNYGPLPLRFGGDFFSAETAIRKKQQYISELEKAKESNHQNAVPIWEEQIRHLERISILQTARIYSGASGKYLTGGLQSGCTANLTGSQHKFRIDTDRLTYANSHGDFHIGQVIVKDYDITVIDWSSACRLPACLDVITSYVFASPACREGAVDVEGLNRYIRAYTKHFPLTEYDIKAMPYVLYFWHCICNYRPDELASIAEKYQPIAMLIQKLLNWLYVHVEELSEDLLTFFHK